VYRSASLRNKLAAFAVALAFVVGAVPAASAAPRLTACPGQGGFGCATMSVPLDRTGVVQGNVAIHYAVQRHGPRPLLIALSGGPGQSGVALASSFAQSLRPALRRYRLAVLDQRGTGDSGVLDCPNVQGLRSLDAITPQAVASCAAQIGPRRAFYSSADTVLDIDALRRTLGADKIALMGISYGTHVALQYARAFPTRVDKLILDSIVGPDGPDAFLLDTYRNMPRVLREQCAHGACRSVTRDPVADVGALVARLNARPIRGTIFDRRGRRHATSLPNPDELSFLITAGDLNPFLQAELPAAISAARVGDTALLMRLRRIGEGGPTSATDLSLGLNVTTGCEDAPLPYPLSAPAPSRALLTLRALAAIPPTEYDPFDAGTVERTSYVDDCMLWPGDTVRRPFSGPLPDVPALLLGGRLDTRTPVENAFATALQLPHASVVTLPGSGHDAIDSDVTGCTAVALRRFVDNLAVRRPCAGRDNGVAPLPLPPVSLGDFLSAPGVGGARGRVLFAVLATVDDARLTALQDLFSGLDVRGGGLRGGHFAAAGLFGGGLRLVSYAFVRGVRVTGTVDATGAQITGRVRVTGRLRGTLRLDRRGGARGVLGGRRVRFEPRRRSRSGSAAAVAGGRLGALLPVDPGHRRPLLVR
jgi:pimeloyl-ACP methyl ester carboxylesterase